MPKQCEQCEIMYINGVRCHEHGCPNAAADAKREARNKQARLARRARDQAMRDCGLVKVRGSTTGRVYWE